MYNTLHIKCTIWKILTYPYIPETITTITIINISFITPQSFLVSLLPFCNPIHKQPLLCFLLGQIMYFVFTRILYKWNNKYIPFCLPSFAKHSYLRYIRTVCSFLFISKCILLYRSTSICLFIHPLIDIRLFPDFWLL